MFACKSISESPSIFPLTFRPASAATKCFPPRPSRLTVFGPSTVVTAKWRSFEPNSSGTLPPTIWLGHQRSSKIHIFMSSFLASSRQTAKSRYHPGPSQSSCGRDSAVKDPLPPTAIACRTSRNRSGLSSPCIQKRGPVNCRASMGKVLNCASRDSEA